MAKQWSPHVVRSGEYVDRLALDRGITVAEIWAYEGNAALGSVRRNVAPGDVLYLPPITQTPVDIVVGGPNKFGATQLGRVIGLRIEVRDDSERVVARSVWPKIGRDGKEDQSTADGIHVAVVGQRMAFRVEVINMHGRTQYTPDEVRWTVDVPVVGSYTQSEGSASRGTFHEGKPEVSFHWIAGGKRSLAVMVRVQGEVMYAYANFDVKAPEHVKVTTETTGVVVGPRPDHGGATFLYFGAKQGLTVDPGIRFELFAAGAVGYDGEVCGVQLVSLKSERELPDGTIEDMVADPKRALGRGSSARKDSWLDTALPYASATSLPMTPSDTGKPAAPSTPAWMEGDTPGTALAGPPGVASNVPSMSRVREDDAFSMYFMFRASLPGSIWVTLARVDWSWSASAEKSPSGWSDAIDPKWNAKVVLDEVELPEWGNHADFGATPARPAWKAR